MTHLFSIISRRALVFCSSLTILLASFAFSTSALVYADNSLPNNAGYIVKGNRAEFREADVTFTVPQLSSLSGNTNGPHITMFVALGGGGNASPGEVAVTTKIVSYLDSNNHQVNQAWWDVWNGNNDIGNGQMDQQININTGDKIWIYVSSDANNDGYDGFEVKDVKTGQTATHYETSSNRLSDSASARCYLQANSDSFGNAYPVAGFNFVTFVGCETYDNGTLKPIGQLSPAKMEQTNNGSTVVQTSDMRMGSNNKDSDFDVRSN